MAVIKFQAPKGTLEIERCSPMQNGEFFVSGRHVTVNSPDNILAVTADLRTVFGDSPVASCEAKPSRNPLSRKRITRFTAGVLPGRELSVPKGKTKGAATAINNAAVLILEATVATLRTDLSHEVKEEEIGRLVRELASGSRSLVNKAFTRGKDGLPSGLKVVEGKTFYDAIGVIKR